MKKILAHIAAAMLLIWSCAPSGAQIVGTLPFQLQNGTVADATQVMADFNKILNDVNTNAAKNGVNTDITALNALVTPITPAQGGTTVYFASTSGGSANAQTVATPTPVGFTLAIGKRIVFIAGFTNTGAMTLNVNSTGATNVFRYTPAGPVALIGGEVVANNYIEAIYDGTRFLLYTSAAVPGYGPETNLASATTTDLGTISSHVVNITGTTTITSFGSSAIVSYPIYQLRFSGVLTLTHSGTLTLPGGANIVTASGDAAIAQYNGAGAWQVISYTKASGAAVATALPTRQTFASGSGTYTTPANVRYLKVTMVGGGGGGGGSGSSSSGGNALSGGNTTFSTFTANGGSGGVGNGSGSNAGGAGGTASGCTINMTGSAGSGSATPMQVSGAGGNSAFFAGGGGATTSTGVAGIPNTGGGASGGGFTGGTSPPGGGGGAGGSCLGFINTPAASYSYAVGAAGAQGAAGTSGSAGNNGALGYILVEEFY